MKKIVLIERCAKYCGWDKEVIIIGKRCTSERKQRFLLMKER
jgi:hypothetical protein